MGWQFPRRPLFLVPLLVGLLLVALSLALLIRPAQLPGGSTSRPLDPGQGMGIVGGGTVLPVPATLRPAHRLQIALQVEDVRGLNLSTKTFRAQGLLRLAWGPDLDALLARTGLEPLRLFHFVNQVEDWNSRVLPTGPPLRQADGQRTFQTLRFEGLFYVNDLNFLPTPFLNLRLPLILEVEDERLLLENGGVLLEPFRDTRVLTGQGVAMEGFQLTGSSMESVLHRQSDPLRDNRPLTTSRVVLTLDYRTEPLAAFLKWILPLLMVMVIVLLAPSLDSSRDELSFGLPSAGLLTLVVLQQSYKAQFPDTPYLTFLDGLYAYSTVVAMAVFLLFVWGGNQRVRAGGAAGPAILRRTNRTCLLVQLTSLVGYTMILLAHWIP